MDVQLLSAMIEELILDHDKLALPGLGTFVAEEMPASFSDRGYTLNPPYRRLSFSPEESDDGLLAALYCRDNGSLSPEEGAAIINHFLSDLSDELRESKSVGLPGLGRLRATRENLFFFVADDTLDISPDTCGLTPVSLRAHSFPVLPDVPEPPQPKPEPPQPAPVKPEPRQLKQERLPEMKAAPARPAPAPKKPAPAKPAARPALASRTASAPTQTKPRRRMHPVLRVTLTAVAAAAILLGVFTAVSRIFPGSTDRLLYTAEEIELINCPEDGSGLPR